MTMNPSQDPAIDEREYENRFYTLLVIYPLSSKTVARIIESSDTWQSRFNVIWLMHQTALFLA
jgi:hypothetical protein